MATVSESFQQVVERFTRRLTKEEVKDFKFASLDDVLNSVEAIQVEQGKQKSMMNLTRIKRFLEAMRQYGTIVEVFLNASSILCFVWGPMKFCLMVASSWADCFDLILDAYKKLAENLPLFSEYQSLFGSNSQMAPLLTLIYEDILEFHIAALRLLKRPTWKQLFRSAWKDFESRFQHLVDNLQNHKQLIESHAGIVQIQETQVERAYVRKQLSMIEEARNQQRRLDVVTWLCAVDPILDHEAAVNTRVMYPSSGKWLLQDNKMKSWLDHKNASSPLLWMNGIPGAGKTILASVIIEACQKVQSIAVIYFYCNYQDPQRKTFVAVARALLVQLLNLNDELLPYLYDKCIGSGQVSLVSSQLYKELLETALKTGSIQTFIVIDGLDECDPLERNAILSFLTPIVKAEGPTGRLRALIVSQDENDIRKVFRGSPVLKLMDAHNKSDIEGYADHWCSEIQKKFGLPVETIQYIRTAVCEGSDGMFLFAKLVLTNLFDQMTPEKLYKEIQPGTFPKGFEKAYSRIVVRIYENQNIEERETAKRLLGWISCSKRALKWHEIQGAICTNAADQTVDFENRRLCSNIRDICGSLVEVLPGDRVRLVHGTAKSYLVHNDYVQIQREEHKLATLCLQYLLFDCFDLNLSDDAIQEYVMGGFYAFQDYAIIHWIDHLEASIPLLQNDVVDNENGLGPAINDFWEAYGSAETSQADIPADLTTKCQHLEKAGYFHSLLLLVSSTRNIRAKEETITALGDLGEVVGKARLRLEKINSLGTIDLAIRTKLHQYYGDNWHKCPRHSCFNFHEGFSTPTSRDSHVSRHDKPFMCTETGCTRKHLGFSTEKELKKHMAIMHPDPAVLFPKVKKAPAKHVCDVCSKDFTRAHNLNAHKRTHGNIRPYKCNLCEKSFVRKYDCERHASTLHPEGISSHVDVTDSVELPDQAIEQE
ncbi:hypothetical protein BKA61DRAFT_619706 [Leptodontidium sp. MPI-SDFR-AT-0119]|nr:hypothetical protein BKA61DRAFT_619706 [Leptodontidium sp. MPI-SDFR-AT-0119]